MLNKKVMLLTILLVSLLAISAVSANESNATGEVVSEEIAIDDGLKINDCDEGIIQANGGTFTELQNIIDAASEGSTINLEKDYAFDESTDDYEEITIEKSLIIDGKNHKVNGLQKSNAFKISAWDGTIDVTLKNISFINCKCEFESGYVNGKIENCNFMDRSYGGAIDFEGVDLTVINSNFINCNETGSGGAIAIKRGICTVYDCNFINCTTNPEYMGSSGAVGSYIQYYSRGGAIFCGKDAQLSVYDCKFLNNNAICSYCGGTGNDGCGGAIHIKSDNAVVKNCYFEGNYASLGGDAIYCEGNHGNLDSCTFNNTANTYGQNDVYWVGDYGIISNCKSTEGSDTLNVLADNTVVNGFENIGLNHEKDDGKFSTLQNKIDDAKKGAKIFLENDYFYDDGFNTSGISISKSLTIDGQGHVLDGLAQSRIISVDGIYTISLRNITFKNGFDGAVNIGSDYQPANNHPYFKIIDCEFENNTGYNGGAIHCELSYVVVENCTFNSNAADNRGGAIMFARSLTHKYCRVTNCTFNNNRASSGGAIYSEHEKFTVENSKFNKNNANSNGGAIDIQITYTSSGGDYLGGHNSKIVGCEFNYNKAGHGGAVYVHADYCSLKSSIFNYNVASYGDAVYWDEGYGYTHGTISDCISVTAGKVENNMHIRAYYEEPKTDVTGCNVTVKILNNILCSDLTKYYGGQENYTVILTDGTNPIANAELNITVDGKLSSARTDSKGQASIPINLPVGNYDAVCEYGDVSNSSKVTVKSTLTTNDAAGIFLNSKVTSTFLNVDGNALASKQVNFKINGKEYSATTDDKGVAAADVDLDAGSYTVTAINPVNNEQKQFKLVINKANSAIALTSSQNKGVVTLTATLTPAASTGNVVFNVNGEDKSAPIKNGKATLTLSDLNPGDYSAAASYNGDKNLNASTSNTVTFSVAESYPVLSANPVTKTYGTSTSLVVYLKDNKGNAIANAIVNVNINNMITPIKTDSNGQATMPIGLAPGSYTATVTYADAKTTAKITVKKATVKMTAKAKTFKKSVKTKKYTITLKNNLNKAIKSTKVTIKVNKKTYTAKTNSKGVATFKITKLTKKGKYTATVTYKGNAYYNKLSKKVKITVK